MFCLLRSISFPYLDCLLIWVILAKETKKLYRWSENMSKAKGKSGIGKGTGKKGWNRWQTSARKAKGVKPYKSKGVTKATSDNKDEDSDI